MIFVVYWQILKIIFILENMEWIKMLNMETKQKIGNFEKLN